MASQFLSLSLFMMLLSFFIIMNSLSTFEDTKARSVIDSLNIALKVPLIFKDEKSGLEGDYVQTLKKGSTIDQIESLFRSSVEGIEVTKNRMGTEIRVAMPRQTFEALLSAYTEGDQQSAGVSAKKNLLPLLVLLMVPENGMTYRLDLVLNHALNPAQSQVLEDADVVSAYAEKLEMFGLPRHQLTTGIAQGKADTIDMFFRRHENFNDALITPVGGARE